MRKSSGAKVGVYWILLVALVVILSYGSTKIWSEKKEKAAVARSLVIREDMTVRQFGEENSLSNTILKNVFGLQTQADLQKKVGEFQLSQQEISSRVEKAMALTAEYESKNWLKIPIKFGSWIAFLFFVFILMRKGRITPRIRKGIYLGAIALFGVVLGSDPSPMGTVKDAIALLGAKGVVFPPRLIALSIFLALVLLANKFICSWGCQLGTLQDLIFRLGRDPEDKKGGIGQIKIPFAWTNGIRIAFFGAFTLAAFLWVTDIIEPIDPFKVYKPAMLGIAGGTFLGGLLLASLFVYRPWCHLFCPFGLVGWLVEKISIFKIQVNYETCIACESCARACPSTVMNGILKQENVIPDCFACGTCIQACPTQSIRFSSGKRNRPPADKFKKKEKGV
jgi:NAD-dependent dihydropyrimidine dehydrogenase PreA subunit